MRTVVDTNQLSTFLDNAKRTGTSYCITLSPYVVLETSLRSNAQLLLKELSSFDVLIGLPPGKVMEDIAELNETGIGLYVPFGQGFRLPTVSEELVSETHRIRAHNKTFADNVFCLAKKFRNKAQNNHVSKYSNFSQAVEGGFLRSVIFNWVSNGNSRSVVVSDEGRLYKAVIQNQYLSRYFKTILYMVVGYSRWWAPEHERHNWDPDKSGNDWVDFTLPLYAADGDVILSNDTTLQKAIAMIEQSGAIQVKTACEL
jgi:hypothetical protein